MAVRTMLAATEMTRWRRPWFLSRDGGRRAVEEEGMDEVARVVLAVESPEVAEEVMQFLDRSGRARVVATAADDRQVEQAVKQLDPDVVVVEPRLAGGLRHAALLAIATKESVADLRAAIRSGARGFFVWPGEREDLLSRVSSTVMARRVVERRATVVAVHASKGGAGATFVASHLAAAIVRREMTCVLLEADLVFGDVASTIGAPDHARTIADLTTLGDELAWAHVRDVMWHHEAGFTTVLPPQPEAVSEVPSETVTAVLEAAATGVDVVVAAVPRTVDEPATACLRLADRVLEIVTLDVASLRASRRALEVLSLLDVAPRIDVVVNRAGRGELVPADVSRVFGFEPLAVIPFDGGVPRAQDRGRLVVRRGRLARTFERLASEILRPGTDAAA